MPLGSRIIERSGRAIFKTVSLASTPPRIPLLYPRFFGTASIYQTVDKPKDSSCNQSDASIISTSDPEDPIQNEGTSDTVASSSTTSTTETPTSPNDSQDTGGVVRRMASKLVVQRIIQQKEIFHALAKYREKTGMKFRNNLRAMKDMEVEEVDVPSLIHFLFLNTPEGLIHSGIRVVVPSTAVQTLLFDVDDSIWRIRHRTSCRIELLQADESTPKTRTLRLSGLSNQIARAWEELQRIVPNCTSDYITAPGVVNTNFNTSSPQGKLLIGGQSQANIRVVRSEDWGYLTQDFDSIQEPKEWTKSTFERYVLCLTLSRNKKLQRYDDRVRNRLVALFEDPDYADVISTSAINTALSYLLKVGEMKELRRLFMRMEIIGKEMEIETFNILLRGAAKFHDLYNFRFLVGLISKRRLTPDAGTWLALLNVVTDFPMQAQIIALMHQKGLMDQVWIMRSLLRILGPLETQWSILREESHEQFIRHMDNRYGTQWLSASSANRILNHFASNGLFSRCYSFIHFMQSRMIKPDEFSIQAVLGHCRKQGNITAALDTIEIFSKLGAKRSSATYDTLFFMAAENHMYSFTRVVWLYACLKNATTFRMRKLVKEWSHECLSYGKWDKIIPPSMCSRHDVWTQTAGKLVVGSTLGNRLLRGAKLGMIRYVSVRLPLKKSRSCNDRRRLKPVIVSQIDEDYKSHQYFRPFKYFHVMLKEALLQDLEWDRGKMWSQKSLKWMFTNTVKVPVVPRSAPRGSSWCNLM